MFQDYNFNNFIEPVTVEVKIASEEYKIGTSLQLDCIVNGHPAPSVHWFIGNNTIPIVTDHHRHIFPNNTLFIRSLSKSDSDEYKCKAMNQYNEASSSALIQVDGRTLDSHIRDKTLKAVFYFRYLRTTGVPRSAFFC